MGLRELKLQREYRSLKDNIINNLYIPALERANSYERSVGFFSSTSLIEISVGIGNLVKNGGTIKLVASPYLSDYDKEAIREGYRRREEIIEESLIRSLAEPESKFGADRLNLLADLIAKGILDIKIAFLDNEESDTNKVGMYHEKLGIIKDLEGNTIAFDGSNNESKTAMSFNYENVNVYCSWKENDIDRVNDKVKAFNNIWNGYDENLATLDFPKVKQEIIDKYKRSEPNYNIDAEEFIERIKEYPVSYNFENPGFKNPSFLKLRDYQLRALNNWAENNYRGIFDMATGTGKTYTGLAAATMLFTHLDGNLAVIIVCPYQHLVEQWVDDINAFNVRPIIGYSGSSQKDFHIQLEQSIIDFNLSIKKYFCFVCTNGTFVTERIQSLLKGIEKDVLLIVDEAHNFGAKKLSTTLEHEYKYRLALSATFERYKDEEGTAVLCKYFGKKCIKYSIDEAIRSGMLTGYYYHPEPIILTERELKEYEKITKELMTCLIRNKRGESILTERGKRLAIKRARLVSGAVMKVDSLLNIIKNFKDDTHMLVYCGATNLFDNSEIDEDIRQIDYISLSLWEKLGINTAQFTSRENREQRKKILEEFEDGITIQALIAIKCLDEGVNIPSIKTAFILASTKNPKEYIQRRGRVLRLAPNKPYSIIYDFVALPRPLEEVRYLAKEETRGDIGLIKSELYRIKEFKKLSMNPYESDSLIDEIESAYELYSDSNYILDEIDNIFERAIYDE